MIDQGGSRYRRESEGAPTRKEGKRKGGFRTRVARGTDGNDGNVRTRLDCTVLDETKRGETKERKVICLRPGLRDDGQRTGW
jgi:hypothetical protein